MRQDEVKRIVAEFVERGGNYFDVAPTYGDSEHRLGPALDLASGSKPLGTQEQDELKTLTAGLTPIFISG